MGKFNSVLIIGSGPIVIGQACEFDYSGTQAAHALREEGIEVILINPNPATIMTDPAVADHVYFLPLELSSIETILSKHKVDAVLPTMGGQTALNVGLSCEALFKLHGVQILGSSSEVIEKTEDREKFNTYIRSLGLATCEGFAVNSLLQGKEAAQRIGFPLIIRASFTLGGKGGGVVHDPTEIESALQKGLESSPVHEVRIEQSIVGWKEYELEVLMDSHGDFVVICTIENIDPMGVHTGDSITVAPAMTLPDRAYQRMRNAAKQICQGLTGFVGGCNVQFALHPDGEVLRVVEVNPRVSRSSALASKATGYPIAKLATKLALGYRLAELKNAITQNTSALFEPVLDYVVVKIPRWNFEKFPTVSPALGLQMKAVGEVMALGVSFQEALFKACYSLELSVQNLFAIRFGPIQEDALQQSLKYPQSDRFFRIIEAFRLGYSLSTVAQLTQIDPWFLAQIEDWVAFYGVLNGHTLADCPETLLRQAKSKGFSDALLGDLFGCEEEAVYVRRQACGIMRHWRMVDTCAAEFEAQTPYYYSAFDRGGRQHIDLGTAGSALQGDGLAGTHLNESRVSDREKVLILGSGPNRIGQGIEFDYCCVHGIYGAQGCGYEAIMLNCNPETVSTDFNIADKLYFEPVYWEYVREVIAHERPDGVVVQLGGQTALKVAKQLEEVGVRILGTSFTHMDLAEDRGRFSDLLHAHDIPYPPYQVILTERDAHQAAATLGFPLLVRPSYVLGGERMKIVLNQAELQQHIALLKEQIPSNRILLDRFLEGAMETEVDALCDGNDVHIMGVMQHIEPAGIHSGDSHSVLPPYDLSAEIIADMERYTRILAKALHVVGFVNIQFAIYQNKVYVIEANPRASRTVPFICKARNIPYVQYAMEIMLGHKRLSDYTFAPWGGGYAIKSPVFSFDRLGDTSKALGPEMKSTGESMYFIQDLEDAYFQTLYKSRNMYLSK